MKQKLILIVLVVILVIPNIVNAAQNNDKISGNIAIPELNGLVGNNNSAKSFLLDLPSGVNASAISTSSLKYSGGNEVIGTAIENGKIKITMRGVANSKTMEVTGYQDRIGNNFKTNVKNAVWRYSDGRRWQISDYNEAKDALEHNDKNATDSFVPSQDPPKLMISAASDQSVEGMKWYDSTKQEIEGQFVINSSISINPAGGPSYLVGGNAKFKNKKIITNYLIGPRPPNPRITDPSMNSEFEDITRTATIPVTGHVQGREYFAYADYYYTATAKLTTYSYNGKVTFDYAQPTEPTLVGEAIIQKPNPNPTKFENKDVAVQLLLSGELLVYTDTSNISEWVFYAKEKDNDSTLQTKKEYSKTLKSSRPFDFIIPKSRINKDNVEQKYTLTVVVRFTKPVVTKNGTVNSLQETFTPTVEVYKKDGPIVTPPPPVKPALKPPVAILSIPDKVMAGSEFTASGERSYDPDGRVVDYFWDLAGAEDVITGSKGETWYPISELGEHRIVLQVMDNDDLFNSTSGIIEVVQPKPTASLRIGGTRKENRKVIITDTSTSPEHYPIDVTKTQLTLSVVSGGTNEAIKYSGTLAGFKQKNVLFKKSGQYKATITVTNTAGFSDSTSITFEIVPDEAPAVYLSVPGKIYRDPDAGNKASASLRDMSISPDYDFLDRRIWEYRYDSNNNGNFADEAWVIFSNENKSELNLQLSQVGKYEVKLTVIEKFDQPTIDEFVTEADRRSADSYTDVLKQPLIERTIEVANRAPEVDWSY
ncbi:hypothetical protein [Paenibacillus sp. sgz500992]|uniref:hypothetical protein n=1 Tax=Paenibacillus sp. sgz500992 TaxID=3242476 RepID=UPI0036D37B8B